jgi:DNA repair protein RadC
MKIFKSNLREVTAKYKTNDSVHNIKVSSSKDVNDYIRKIYPVEITVREAMVVLYLNNSHRTLGYSIASIGGITATLLDVRLVLQSALLVGCTSLILIHNHPSGGSLNPSQADIAITEKIKKAAELHDIKVLDHLILAEDAYYSFADKGKL